MCGQTGSRPASIPRSIAGEIRNLGPDQRAEGKDDRQCNDHDEESGWMRPRVDSAW
jgi:hypothetical protein